MKCTLFIKAHLWITGCIHMVEETLIQTLEADRLWFGPPFLSSSVTLGSPLSLSEPQILSSL